MVWEDLLDDIKTRAPIPSSQSTYNETRLLRLTNGELRARIVPMVDKVRENYYLFDVDTAINSTGVYDIHKRAVGAKLFSLSLVDGQKKKSLAFYTSNEIEDFDSAPGDEGFFFKRSQVILCPRVPSSWSYLRQTLLLSPNNIVASDDAAQITNINTGTGVLTCSSVPSTWSTANKFDIVQSQAHFDTLSIDLTASIVTTGTSGSVTFATTDLPSRLAVGDWISLAEQTPVVQCPVEFHPLLAQLVANVVLRSQGDVQSLQTGMQNAKELMDSLKDLISPRIQGEGKKIVNRTGMLRRGGGY